MTSKQQKEVLRYVIEYFSKQNKNAHKILVQKAIYFLNFIGIVQASDLKGISMAPSPWTL